MVYLLRDMLLLYNSKEMWMNKCEILGLNGYRKVVANIAKLNK